jgi:hypothetical protein
MRMQREEAIKRLLDLKAIGRVMDYLRGGGSAHAGLLVMLLSNLTVSEAGSEQLLQLGSAALAGFNVYAAAAPSSRLSAVCAACMLAIPALHDDHLCRINGLSLPACSLCTLRMRCCCSLTSYCC